MQNNSNYGVNQNDPLVRDMMNTQTFFNDYRQKKEDAKQVSLFEAGATGLVAGALAKFLFGNRG